MTPERAAGLKLARYMNPWTIELRRSDGVWVGWCVDAPITLAEAEAREDFLKAANPAATFRVVPWLNMSQWQHVWKLRESEHAAKDGEIRRLRYFATELAENFAWSGVVADCEELRLRLNGLIDGLRAALATASQPSGITGELPAMNKTLITRLLVPNASDASATQAEPHGKDGNGERVVGAGKSMEGPKCATCGDAKRVRQCSSMSPNPVAYKGSTQFPNCMLPSGHSGNHCGSIAYSSMEWNGRCVELAITSYVDCPDCSTLKALGKSPKQGEPGWLADEVL